MIYTGRRTLQCASVLPWGLVGVSIVAGLEGKLLGLRKERRSDYSDVGKGEVDSGGLEEVASEGGNVDGHKSVPEAVLVGDDRTVALVHNGPRVLATSRDVVIDSLLCKRNT